MEAPKNKIRVQPEFCCKGSWNPLPNELWKFFGQYKPFLRHSIFIIFHNYLPWYCCFKEFTNFQWKIVATKRPFAMTMMLWSSGFQSLWSRYMLRSHYSLLLLYPMQSLSLSDGLSIMLARLILDAPEDLRRAFCAHFSLQHGWSASGRIWHYFENMNAALPVCHGRVAP